MKLNARFEDNSTKFSAQFEESEEKMTPSFGETQTIHGKDGKDGVDGKSAYEIAVDKGFKGTEEEWLASLKGENGKDGADGHTPVKGTDYFTDADKQEMVDDVIDQIPPSGVSDVQLNGATIVDENGVATIPVVTAAKGGYGIVRVGNLANGQIGVKNINGAIALAYPEASINGFTQRKAQGSQYSGVVGSKNFDLAVKVAMTDGIGDAWTEVEQASARARMGAVSMEEVLAAIKAAMGGGGSENSFPTGEAGFYRHGTNFTELLCTWDEYVEKGVDIDGQHYEGGVYTSPHYIMFTVPADVIIPDGYAYEVMGIECGNVVLPYDVNSISIYEYGYMNPSTDSDIKLTTVYCKATVPPNYPSLSGCPNLTKIVVPTGCANAYKSATDWCDYAEIIVEGIIE